MLNYFLIIGADNALEIPTWHCPDGVLELANVLVVRRPGSDLSGVGGDVATRCRWLRVLKSRSPRPTYEPGSAREDRFAIMFLLSRKIHQRSRTLSLTGLHVR